MGEKSSIHFFWAFSGDEDMLSGQLNVASRDKVCKLLS